MDPGLVYGYGPSRMNYWMKELLPKFPALMGLHLWQFSAYSREPFDILQLVTQNYERNCLDNFIAFTKCI